MAKIAIIGGRDTIIGFKALGLTTFPAKNAEEAGRTLRKVTTEEYATIFITDNLARELEEEIHILEQNIPLYPSIVIIPSHRGSIGLGMEKIRSLVEKAVGTDLFAQKK
jgi:V/A-type H+-transporting ATPase subunit F